MGEFGMGLDGSVKIDAGVENQGCREVCYLVRVNTLQKSFGRVKGTERG
jgi:hypothetical protein